MAYRAPGVYVKDVYTEPERQPRAQEFWPVVIAPVRNVVEHFILDGVTLKTTSTQQVINLAEKIPGLTIFDTIVPESLRVYLIPETGSKEGYYFGSITQKNNAMYGFVSGPTQKGFIDITAHVGKSELNQRKITLPAGSTVLNNAVAFGDVSSFWNTTQKKITANCSVVVEFETRKQLKKVITESINLSNCTKQVIADDKIRLIFNLPSNYIPDKPSGNNYTLVLNEDEVSVVLSAQNVNIFNRLVDVEVPVTNAATFELESINLTFPVLNPIYTTIMQVSTKQAIEEQYGQIHPLNTVAYAAYVVKQITNDPVNVFALPYADWAETSQVLSRALEMIEQQPNFYAVYIGLDSSNQQLLEMINRWLDKYTETGDSSISPKIAITGFSSFDAYGTLEDTKTAVANLVSKISGIEQKRLRVIANPAAIVEHEVQTSKIEVVVPGHLYGAEFVAKVYTMMNNTDKNPSETFSMKQVSIFKRLLYPNQNVNWFTARELNTLAEAGYWILYQKSVNDPVIVRHGLTTAERKTTTAEDVVVRTVDYVMLRVRSELETLVGNVKLNQTTLNTVFKIRLNDLINQMIAKGILEQGSAIKTLEISPETKDKLLVTLKLVVAFPSNVIELTVEV